MSAEATNFDESAWIVKSEAIQREAWRTLASAASMETSRKFGIHFEEDGAELYQAARDIPGFFANKVFSFGVDQAVTPDRIERAKTWLKQKCAPNSMLAIPPLSQPEHLQGWLGERGFERHPLDVAIFMMAEGMEIKAARPSGIVVRAVTGSEADLFGQVMCEGFGVTSAAAAWPAALVGQQGMTAYLAYEESEAIGSASMFVSGDWAWLFIASTRPDFRKRGAQTALLNRRIQDGRAAGVRTFVVAVYSPAKGYDDAAFASYRNIQRVGFKLGYVRPNYVVAD